MIVSIYDKKKIKRLNEKNLVVETHYGNNLVISTDGLRVDNVGNKPIIEKRYFKNNECIYVDKNFNQKILHTVKMYKDENEEIKCPNCGNIDKASNMIDNCPYCGTDFNFGINNLNSSQKIRQNKLINPFMILLGGIFALIISFFMEDVARSLLNKVIFFILGCIIFAPLNIILNLLILAIRKKDVQYSEVLEGSFDKKWLSDYDSYTFYNDLNKDLLVYLYGKNDLVDFDICKIKDINFNNDKIDVVVKVKEVYYNKKIKIKYNSIKLYMQYNDVDVVKDNYKVIKCHNCNSNLSMGDKECSHCGSINIYREKWIASKIED